MRGTPSRIVVCCLVGGPLVGAATGAVPFLPMAVVGAPVGLVLGMVCAVLMWWRVKRAVDAGDLSNRHVVLPAVGLNLAVALAVGVVGRVRDEPVFELIGIIAGVVGTPQIALLTAGMAPWILAPLAMRTPPRVRPGVLTLGWVVPVLVVPVEWLLYVMFD